MNNDPIINYRGAKARLSELTEKRVSQLEQQQGTRMVSYRGAAGEVPVSQTNQRRTVEVSYRGIRGQVEV
ncbi:MAG: hypothetical protein AAF226_08440 [Verrucomicrobiota bacterium]